MKVIHKELLYESIPFDFVDLLNTKLFLWFFSCVKKHAAIISYKAFPLKKEVKKLIHLVFHAIALILGIVGIYTAFKFHNESGIANLYSLHSWLGIGVIVLYGIQVNHCIWLSVFGFAFTQLKRGSQKQLLVAFWCILTWKLDQTWITDTNPNMH